MDTTSLADTAQARIQHARSAARGRSAADGARGPQPRAPADHRRPASRHNPARARQHAEGNAAGARGSLKLHPPRRNPLAAGVTETAGVWVPET
jgi:hypothetical protein